MTLEGLPSESFDRAGQMNEHMLLMQSESQSLQQSHHNRNQFTSITTSLQIIWLESVYNTPVFYGI